MFGELWPLISVVLGVIVLLVLIIKFKINAFISLIVTSIFTGIILGMPLNEIVKTVEAGMGSTLGSVAIIFGLGAILGKLLADGGGANRIADTLIDKFGEKYIKWAMILASFIIGIALFFEVGLVLLIPLAFTISKRLGVSHMTIGIPMAIALSVTHGFLPPHPGPVVIAKELNANLGQVLLYGMIIAIPTVAIVGGLLVKVLPKLSPSAFTKKVDMTNVISQVSIEERYRPGFGISVFTALLPVILMLFATIVQMVTGHQDRATNQFESITYFIGNAPIAMLISLLFAIYSMGVRRNRNMNEIMESAKSGIIPIGMMLLILGAGGSFKEILIDGGVGKTIEHMFVGSSMSPILLAWIVSSLLRIAQGSATVAAISTTGIVLPLLQATDANLALVTLAIGAGSIIFSHVNDTGFWIFKEYFGLTVKETFLTWSLLETAISVCGLGFVLILNMII
ncbi:gluconate:H+ symporter [Staphylococcus equorum]|uniref:gluconate:H+ symporter n=1 Tax=Staphylococcus equorum TaxID=246432 RepID=UPI002DBAF15A|nr:gluconate:H+ symporter [Staphylococcus equorum]MEB8107793.1 gluconate:H+ symporter [Staphylococcus equorum]MEB8174126.1 gluconate:H+ symporter [Staphylococcus equorum]